MKEKKDVSFTVDSNGNIMKSDDVKAFKDAKKIVQNNNSKYEVVKNNHLGIKISLFIIIVIVFLSLFLSVIFAILNIKSDKIAKNVKIFGVDVSNMTQEEAKEKVNEKVNQILTTDILLKHNDQDFTMTPEIINTSYNIEDMVKQAYLVGRNSNIFKDNFEILKTKKDGKDFEIKASINDDDFENLCLQTEAQFEDYVQDPIYEINGTNLIITAGKNGQKIDRDKFKEDVIQRLEEENQSSEKIDLPTEEVKCADIDVEGARKEIYKEPVDAKFTTNPYSVVPSQTGLDFKISVDDAKKMVSEKKDKYTIPLKVIYPKVTTDMIGDEAFPDLLATYTTNYSSSGSNRSNNIAVATAKINGTVLMPGETFSYNGKLGNRTTSAGYREAAGYANGKVVPSIGGGVCQVSSTLYNAVLRANLKVVYRVSHMFDVGYVPIGTDATVAWPSPDFKFENNRNYPIKISATTSGKNVTIRIFGVKQADDVDIEIKSYKTGTIPFQTTYTTDSSLPKGTSKVVQGGSNGATSITYKISKKNGQVVGKEVVSTDRYSPHNKVIARN